MKTKQCKKHDKISECGACGLKFYNIPLPDIKTLAKDKKKLIKLCEFEIKEWVKFLIKVKKQ